MFWDLTIRLSLVQTCKQQTNSGLQSFYVNAQNQNFLRLCFSLMVIETEELFNHGIEGERQAGESLLARASVTEHNFTKL